MQLLIHGGSRGMKEGGEPVHPQARGAGARGASGRRGIQLAGRRRGAAKGGEPWKEGAGGPA